MTTPVHPADSPDAIARAVERLRAGGLVAMPTETVYGLAADAANGEAVARLYEAKGRPRFNPLIAHVADTAAEEALAQFTPLALRLADAFWPGPLTLVLAAKQGGAVSDLARGGLDTIALRAPAHPAAQALLRAFGGPLVAPSANPSEGVSPTTASHVAEGLGARIDMILDGGPCPVGLESTVIDARGDSAVLLRPGGLDRKTIEAVAGPLAEPGEAAAGSPGLMRRHYAPSVALRLNAKAPRAGEAYLGFGAHDAQPGINLSPKGDMREAAANLFAYLRELDAAGLPIAAAPIPQTGLGEAINDRLRRASAR